MQDIAADGIPCGVANNLKQNPGDQPAEKRGQREVIGCAAKQQ
jgi:hypothetical protein